MVIKALGAVMLTVVLALSGCSSQDAKPAPSDAASSAPPKFDVKAENAKPGTRAWNISADEQASDTELAGFVNHDSALPGTTLDLKATTTADSFTVTAYRMGYYGGDGAREIWKSGDIKAISQPRPVIREGNEVSAANWKVNSRIATDGWPQGLYLLRMSTTIDGKEKAKWIPLVMRSHSLKGRLGIVYATPTYQAYNEWGGWSLYKGPAHSRATHVSFDRPYDRSGARLVTAGERQITAIAERDGLNVAYASQVDINADPKLVDGARGLVSLGHDEYWTKTMRDAWEGARDKGTNLAFMGANSVYWRVRMDGRTLIGYKIEAAADPVQGEETTAMWRSYPKPRPENSFTGQLYECFPARGPLTVTDPSFWAFRGTGATQGSTYNGLVGVEIDRAYPIKGTPDTLHVAAHSPVNCGSTGPTFSDFTYYTAPSQAGVVAVGTMSWAVGLLGPNAGYNIDQRASDFSAKVTSNVLTAMAAGPLGKTYPAQSNLAQLNASPSTRTGTGGSIGK